MNSKEGCPAILAVIGSVLLLTSGTAGAALAASAPADEPGPKIVDDRNVVEEFKQQLSTLETAQFTRTVETTIDNETFSTTERIQADFEDSQLRSETVDGESNFTRVRDGSNVTTYNADENTVTGHEATGSFLTYRLEMLDNESKLDFEYVGVDVANDKPVYELEATPARDSQVPDGAEASMTVYLDMDTHFPVQIESQRSSEDSEFSSTVTYEDVTLNEAIPDSTFDLELPDDVEDLRNDSGPDISQYDTHDNLVSNTEVDLPPADLTGNFSFDSAAIFEHEDIDSVSMTYTDGEEQITVVVQPKVPADRGYSESDQFDPVEIGDTTGYINVDDGFVSLSVDGDQPYNIYGQTDEETAIDIAEDLIDE